MGRIFPPSLVLRNFVCVYMCVFLKGLNAWKFPPPPRPPHKEHVGVPNSSVGKESACNAGDSSLIPGSGRSAGEGIGYPLQYSWASLVAQLIKNPPTMWETWVCSLGWEDSLEMWKATHSSILAWRIHEWVHGVAKSRTRLSDFHKDYQDQHFFKVTSLC